MRVGSLFSGMGGFDLGLEMAGMEIAFQCEIDRDCNRALAMHWPNVRRYGDIRDIGLRHAELITSGREDGNASRPNGAREHGRGGVHGVDLICGGSEEEQAVGSPSEVDTGRSQRGDTPLRSGRILATDSGKLWSQSAVDVGLAEAQDDAPGSVSGVATQRTERSTSASGHQSAEVQNQSGPDNQAANETGSRSRPSMSTVRRRRNGLRPYSSRSTRWTDRTSESAIALPSVSCQQNKNGSSFGGIAPKGGDASGSLSRVDLICGGFPLPCQDLSVAGKRAGLDGERSGLWFEFKRVLSELRPTWAIIENVPGLLSSNQGRDFGIVLSGLAECGFAGVGWRVLDSRYFGVAQRRRRVFIVGGPSRGSVAQVLSLCPSCAGDSQASKTEREGTASTLRGRSHGVGVNEPGRGGEDDVNLVLAHSLRTQAQLAHREDVEDYIVAPTLDANMDRKWASNRWVDNGFAVAHSLSSDGFDASEDGTGRGTPLTVIQDARGIRDKAQNGIGIQESETMYTLDGTSQHAVAQASVRRLTPTECLRLQAFPDSWLDLNPPLSDGAKYRMTGNAVTVSVIRYLGERIMAVSV